MYAHELYEAGKPIIVVTYPGRFQPFHQGHAGVFSQLQKQFGRDSVYILTSNDQSSAKSPFNFTDKYQLITTAGVPGDRIIETNQMYKLPEQFDPARTIFVTAVGAPDKDRLNPDTFTKRDQKDKNGNVIKPAGSASYYKTWDESHQPMTADHHGYVVVVPEIHKDIKINGKTYDVSHGTECRNLWNQVRNNPEAAKQFLIGLYGRASAELVQIFNKIPESVGEDIGQVDSNYSSSPISGSRVFHEGTPEEKHYHNWAEFDQDRAAQVIEYLREIRPELIEKFGIPHLEQIIQTALTRTPNQSLTQLASQVIRQCKQDIEEGILGSLATGILNKIKSAVAKYKLGTQVQNQKADLAQQYQELAREGEMIMADPNTDPNTKFAIEQQLKILNNLASSANLNSKNTLEETYNRLKESYEYMPPGAGMAQTRRVLNKTKPAGKFVWKKPNQIGGSFTDQQLRNKGFRQGQFGGWGGTEEMWQRLHTVDEVAMNPKAFAQSIEQGASKGVLVGFEFEVLIPKVSVEGGPEAGAIPTFSPDDNSWVDGKTVADLLVRLKPPVTNAKWSSIFHDLFKNKASVGRELGYNNIYDGYVKWSNEKISEAVKGKEVQFIVEKVKEILTDEALAQITVEEGNRRDLPPGPLPNSFAQQLANKGIDANSPDFTPDNLSEEDVETIRQVSVGYYYYLPSQIDRKFFQISHADNEMREVEGRKYNPRSDGNNSEPISHFTNFCREVYGTDDLKELLKSKWAFRGRTNNATPALKEKLWYYLTPNAPEPQSLRNYRSSRDPEYIKGAEFLKNNLAPSFGDSITIFRHYHQENKKLDRWYIEPDGSLRPNQGDYSAEVVSPPLLANKAMQSLQTFYQHAKQMNLYTNKSTGLHINVSIPDTLDVLKLAMFVGDQYVLKAFGRENNSYAISVIRSLQNQGNAPVMTGDTLAAAEKELQRIATGISGNHFATVNFNGKYVSFRHAGGDYLNNMPEIINTVGRFIRAMIIAADPNAYRAEYLSKLVKMFGPKTTQAGTGVDSGELQKLIKTGIPAITYDAALRPGYSDPDALIEGTMRDIYTEYQGNLTAFIKPDPTARQRLLASSGWGLPTKEHLTNGPDNIFYTVTVVPISAVGLKKIQDSVDYAARMANTARGLYDQYRNRAGVGIMHVNVLNRSNPEFNKVISALRGRSVTGPKGVLPEDAAGVGVVATNKKMAKDPRYSMSITKDVKPSTPKNMLRAFRLSEDFAARINPEDFKIKNFDKLDHILVNLCEMVVEGQKLDAESIGMVAACVLDPENQFAFGINYLDDAKGKRVHAERAAILNYEAEHGPVPAGSIIITTLSPCCHPMDDRYGDSCTEIINDTDCHKVYCGYKDPTQEEDMNKTFHVMQTRNPAIIKMCKKFAATFLGNVVKEDAENHSVTEDDMMTMIKEFMPLAMKELKLKKIPHIELQPHIESHDGQATFGRFVNEEEKIYLGIADRHPVDILRTLAHELVHFKQYIDGKMYHGAGDTGTPIENEAHWRAGIIMRHFNKKYPDAIKSKPLELEDQLDEKWSGKYKRSINCTNPKGFSQKAHCAGRKKSESTIKEFAPNDSGDNGDDDILFRYAKMWYNGGQPVQQKIEKILDRAGWEIGELESEEGGAFVVKSTDEHGDSYIGWSAKELTDIKENFADGRNPQDKGDSARHGIPKKASLASLDKIVHSKSASPRKKQLAHWQANMRRGKNK